jgi:hypothetical protein
MSTMAQAQADVLNPYFALDRSKSSDYDWSALGDSREGASWFDKSRSVSRVKDYFSRSNRKDV